MQRKFANVDPNASDPYASVAEQERRSKQFGDAVAAAQNSLAVRLEAMKERGREMRLDVPHDETLVGLFLAVVSGGQVFNGVHLSASCAAGEGQFTINRDAVSVQQALPCAVPALLSQGARPGQGGSEELATFCRCLVGRAGTPTRDVSTVPIRVGGNTPPPTKTHDVKPQYPSDADGTPGMVIVDLVIGPDGKVVDARLLRGSSRSLNAAALDAVRQWEFTPTEVDGRPVPVIMTVTVNVRR